MITQDFLKSILNYDPETGIFTWLKRAGNYAAGSNVANGYDQDGYKRTSISRKTYKQHRLAWLYVYGSFPVEQIDHINGDKSDNRICNLRKSNSSQNMQNTSTLKRSASKIKGVHWSAHSRKWRAVIIADKKSYHIGLFHDIKDAEKAVIEARNKLHGEFANHGEFKG